MGYDLIIIGGGLSGVSLAKNMAEQGLAVLALEREAMHRWGIAEARKLGIYSALLDACGHQTQRWKTYFDGKLMSDQS